MCKSLLFSLLLFFWLVGIVTEIKKCVAKCDNWNFNKTAFVQCVYFLLPNQQLLGLMFEHYLEFRREKEGKINCVYFIQMGTTIYLRDFWVILVSIFTCAFESNQKLCSIGSFMNINWFLMHFGISDTTIKDLNLRLRGWKIH